MNLDPITREDERLDCARELAAALGVPADKIAELVVDLGLPGAWPVLIDMVETYVHHADRAAEAEAEAGQPRRPGTPEAAVAYPTEGEIEATYASRWVDDLRPSALFGDH